MDNNCLIWQCKNGNQTSFVFPEGFLDMDRRKRKKITRKIREGYAFSKSVNKCAVHL